MVAKIIALVAFVCVAECMRLPAGERMESSSFNSMETIKRDSLRRDDRSIEEKIKAILRIKETKDNRIDQLARQLIRDSEAGRLSDNEIGQKWNDIEKMHKLVDREAQRAIEDITADIPVMGEFVMVEEPEENSDSLENEGLMDKMLRQVEINEKVSVDNNMEKMILNKMMENSHGIESNVADIAETVRRQYMNRERNMNEDSMNMMDERVTGMDESSSMESSSEMLDGSVEGSNEVDNLLEEVRHLMDEKAVEVSHIIYDKVNHLVRDMIFRNEKSEVLDGLMKEVHDELEHESVHVVDELIHSVEHLIGNIINNNNRDMISKILINRAHPELMELLQ